MSTVPQISQTTPRITPADLKMTKDGWSAKEVGGTVYVAVGTSPIHIKYAYGDESKIDRMTERDCYGLHKSVEDLPGFISALEEMAEHHRQKARLGRREEDSKIRTPWGESQGCTVYGPGVKAHSTAGHGGFQVFSKVNKVIPEPYRNADGWYEEDAEWAKVAAGLPHLFTDYELRLADKTLRNWFPDEYEAVNGIVLKEGESRNKDERLFKERHANDWIVTAASMSKDHEGMVECWATLGGVRGGWYNGVEVSPEKKEFLVPKDEYNMGRFGFVIDPDRHQEIGAGAKPGM